MNFGPESLPDTIHQEPMDMNESRAQYRHGVDIGDTFTDAVLLSEASGATRIAKVPSTPSDPSRGFLEAVDRILGDAGIAPEAISYLVHGTTVATNSIIEGKTPRTAFITTEGFRDMLEIGRQVRPTLYDVHFEKPRPLVPRNLCFEVSGAARRARGRAGTAGRGEGPRDREDAGRAGRRLGRGLPAPRLPEPRPRAAHRRAAAHPPPGTRHLALLRGVSGVPGVLPRQHHHHQRLRAPGARPLPRGHRESAARPRHDRGAAHHAVERRGAHLRDRRGEAGLHGRVGSGRRGHRRQLDRRRAGLRQRDLLRHGRHHRQGGTHPRRPAQGHQGVRGRRPGQPGGRTGARERLSHPDPGDRSGRDRRRRRQHRLGRFGRHPAGGAAERGRRPRAHLLRPGRRGAHHHRRQPDARPARPRVLPGRGDGAQRRRGP